MRQFLAVLLMALTHSPVSVSAQTETCSVPPTPVVSLNIGSRYTDESKSRSDIDTEGNAAVNEALAPIEGFLRDLVKTANAVTRQDGDVTLQADCVIAQLHVWAEADAFSDLGTITANFAIGSRIAGFAFIYRQVAPYSTEVQKRKDIEAWFQRRAAEQMLFWEEDATYGAKRGNLRAWATLAINLVGEINDDPVALRWSAWSASFLQCQALDDGSLPQEMRRGKYALHYQLHAIAPMVLTTLLLERQGLSITGICDNALDRIVAFAANDLMSGEASEAYSGKKQSYFDGTETLRGFELSWLEAYLILTPIPELEKLADAHRPLSHSKLGGNQRLVLGLEK
jgi:poly(beta-D-mannuronate) lyase